MKFKFKLGSKIRDKITGFEGIVSSRSQWLHNCNTYGLQPEALKDGKPQDRQHFDEPQLELIQENIHKPQQKTGGPTRPVERTNKE